MSDVVGVPSHNESFGLVALEAQACGRPVVATDVGGLRHAVRDGHTGRLVTGHGPEQWARALAAVLDDPVERARLGANAAGYASAFSWSNTAAATLDGVRGGPRRHPAPSVRLRLVRRAGTESGSVEAPEDAVHHLPGSTSDPAVVGQQMGGARRAVPQ